MAARATAKKTTTTTRNTSGTLRPVKEKLTKSALLSLIAERTEMQRKQVDAVLSELETIMLGSIHPNGVGEFMFPGLFKIALRKVAARKAGTMIRNPSTGEMMAAAAKPASVRVKIRPLAKMKAAAEK